MSSPSSSAAASSSSIPRFKVVILGDGGVGKTSFLKRFRTGEFEKRYIATMGVEVNPQPLYTSKGQVVINTWDTAGQERFNGLGEGYAIGAQAAIIMCDVTNRTTFKSFSRYYRMVRKVCGDIPIDFVGNKIDCKDRKVMSEEISQWFQALKKMNANAAYYDISAKSNYNFDKPFLYLLSRLMGDETLQLVEGPARFPPEVRIDAAADPARVVPELSLARATPPLSSPSAASSAGPALQAKHPRLERMTPSFVPPFHLPGVHWEPHPSCFPIQGLRFTKERVFYWSISKDKVELSIRAVAVGEPLLAAMTWDFAEYSPNEIAELDLCGNFDHPVDIGALQAVLRSVR